ncbi:hypothetical protein HHK36_023522 [Tetracentron sinense]|uniref:Uncharacterized protein n=1 Tax=Tetracentron sinense TaxID=13715 RepID=A0A834YNE2_TETSI|nr:hypothetical protein HHK36_023522 [Tetracentron sinense]
MIGQTQEEPQRGARMDPLEQLRINEVLYLHSLWHNGPPRSPNPNPNPRGKLSDPTAFKKNKKIKNRGRRGKKTNHNPNPPPVSDVEWPCEPIPDPKQETGWPESIPSTRSASAEEQARFFAVQLQQKGLKECKDYFFSKVGSDYEGEDEEDEWMDDEDDESELFNFFLGIFTEDIELRSYYEKNFEGGEFCCLVCGAIEKKGKRFKDCIALVQHSTAISKTKQKSAHRAFGHAVCGVLGWDTNRLPSIVLSSAEPLSRILAKANADSQVGSCQEKDLQEKVIESVNVDNCELGSNGIDDDNQENDLQDKAVDSLSVDDGRLMDCEAATGPIEDDADDKKEDLQEEIVATTETYSGEEMDCMAGPNDDDADDQKEALHTKIADAKGTYNGEEMDYMARLKIKVEDFQKDIVDSIETDQGKSVEGLHKGIVVFEENDEGELVNVQ